MLLQNQIGQELLKISIAFVCICKITGRLAPELTTSRSQFTLSSMTPSHFRYLLRSLQLESTYVQLGLTDRDELNKAFSDAPLSA